VDLTRERVLCRSTSDNKTDEELTKANASLVLLLTFDWEEQKPAETRALFY
jgi:hypothetical protein